MERAQGGLAGREDHELGTAEVSAADLVGGELAVVELSVDGRVFELVDVGECDAGAEHGVVARVLGLTEEAVRGHVEAERALDRLQRTSAFICAPLIEVQLRKIIKTLCKLRRILSMFNLQD